MYQTLNRMCTSHEGTRSNAPRRIQGNFVAISRRTRPGRAAPTARCWGEAPCLAGHLGRGWVSEGLPLASPLLVNFAVRKLGSSPGPRPRTPRAPGTRSWHALCGPGPACAPGAGNRGDGGPGSYGRLRQTETKADLNSAHQEQTNGVWHARVSVKTPHHEIALAGRDLSKTQFLPESARWLSCCGSHVMVGGLCRTRAIPLEPAMRGSIP